MSDSESKRKANLTIIKSNNEISLKNVVADYDPSLALDDIGSIYDSDEFIDSIPDGETNYQLLVDGEDIDVDIVESNIEPNMEKISTDIIEALYKCKCYADLIVWHKVTKDCYEDIYGYHKYNFIDEFMQNVISERYITTLFHPITSITLAIPDDNCQLYYMLKTSIEDIINLYELYIFNYNEDIQTIIDNQLVVFTELKHKLTTEVETNECN